MRIFRNTAWLLSGTLALFLWSSIVYADAEKDASYVYGHVMSPFCPGRLLEDCPTDNASKLRAEMKKEIEGGKTKEEVMGKFFEAYGEGYRAAPKAEGFGVVAWLVPFLFLTIGAGILISKKQPSPDEISFPETTLDAELEARIRQDMEK